MAYCRRSKKKRVVLESWDEYNCPFKEYDKDFTCGISCQPCELVDDDKAKECTYCVDFDELMRQRKEIENE